MKYRPQPLTDGQIQQRLAQHCRAVGHRDDEWCEGCAWRWNRILPTIFPRRPTRPASSGHDASETPTLEQLSLGATLRIAAALEKMADPYVRLLDRVAYLARAYDEERETSRKLHRRIIALRGVVTRTKKGRRR